MRALVRSWPAATRVAAGGGARAGTRRARDDAASRADEHYSLLLPSWLNARLGVHGRAAVEDIVWAQHCLFAFVRNQDDVFDGRPSSRGLVFLAHEFLAEAERAFARHLREGAFWRFYRAALTQTARAVLTVDGYQRGAPMAMAPLMTAYARQSAIFKVGTAAVCLPCGARDVFRRCSRFADHLAIAGQLLDDLEDLRDDLADGRLNAAARFLVPDAGPRMPDIEQRIARALVLGDRLAALLRRIRGHVRAAGTAIAPLALPQAHAYAEAIRADLARVEASLNRGRVAAVFGPLLAAH